ncbi:MAG: hypothetical protein DRJ15_10665 [Bacteroidetes bacterium]|nr:MAG: hypothetical protein DRJ15_10665 [Bacteroidota bacterium]
MTSNVIDGMQITATEQLQAKNIGEHLLKHYPGHLWAVQVYQGLVIIKNLALSGNWGFVLHQDKMDNDGKDIVRSAGELLERYNLSRGRLIENQIGDLKRNYKGEIIRV